MTDSKSIAHYSNSKHGFPKTIVLVSEDSDYIQHLVALEQREFYTLLIVETEQELEAISKQELKPQLLLFDVLWLQKHSGKPLLYSTYHYHIPCVLVTDHFSNPFLAVLRQTGTFNCIRKYCDFDELFIHLDWAITFESLLRQTEIQATQLQVALKQERDINVAIGLLMAKEKLTRKESFEKLRKQARDTRQKMSKICLELLDDYELTLTNNQSH